MAAMNIVIDFFALFDTLGPFGPLIVVLPILLSIRILLNQFSHPTTLPRGPASNWLWGTKLDSYSWRQFENWTKEYGGEMFTVWLGQKPLVVIGTYSLAMEILEKESSITSSRPLNIIANRLSGGKRILSIPYGNQWKKLRKALHQGLTPKMAESYEPIQLQGAVKFMLDIIEDPDAFQTHASVYAASVIMTITYGKTSPTRYSDPDIISVTRCLGRLGQASNPSTAYLVESYPLLEFLPSFLAPWKKTTKEWHEEEQDLFLKKYLKVREEMGKGEGRDCFARWLLENQKEYELTDEEAAYVCGSTFGAGSDTTASALTIAIMAMTLYPSITKKAQHILDKLVGRGRAPDFSDYADLIYIQAFIKEVHRWRPVSSGGFLHATTAPLIYKNYIIPTGTSIVGNHWSISRDPNVFENPEAFIPDRWITVEGELRKDINHVGFGFGRRVCSGRNVADRSLFVNIVLLLWTFNFNHKIDKEGKEIPIDSLAFTTASNSHPPASFPAALAPTHISLTQSPPTTQDCAADRNWLLKTLREEKIEALICMLNDKIDEELIEAAGPSLKIVSSMSAGFDHVDIQALKKRGIKLATTPDALTDATADIGAMLVLMSSRRAGEGIRAVADGKWPSMPWSPLLLCGHALQRSTVGVLGFGKIGQLTLKRLLSFGISRALYTTSKPGVTLPASKDYFNVMAIAAANNVEIRAAESLDELARESDFLIICCAQTPDTIGLIDAKFLSSMKKNAYLINTARGPIVDSNALAAAIEAGTIAGAGLDVVTGEPNITADHPLVKDQRVVLLPHIGSATLETRGLMSLQACQNAFKGLDLPEGKWINQVIL